jgi:hypothetical protein
VDMSFRLTHFNSSWVRFEPVVHVVNLSDLTYFNSSWVRFERISEVSRRSQCIISIPAGFDLNVQQVFAGWRSKQISIPAGFDLNLIRSLSRWGRPNFNSSWVRFEQIRAYVEKHGGQISIPAGFDLNGRRKRGFFEVEEFQFQLGSIWTWFAVRFAQYVFISIPAGFDLNWRRITSRWQAQLYFNSSWVRFEPDKVLEPVRQT